MYIYIYQVQHIFKGNIRTSLKRQVYNSCVLPAVTYGVETWALITHAKNKLAATQTKMKRSALNITYPGRKTIIWVKEKTNVTSAGYEIADEHCVSPSGNPTKGGTGRPARRWREELDGYWKGTIWQRIVQTRQM